MRYYAILMIGITANAFGAAVGSDGIDSIQLGLDGTGILIGQAELGRSSKHGHDWDELSLANTNPAGVYTQVPSGGFAIAGTNVHIDEHATQVAQLMIGTGGLYEGVSPSAQLHSIGLYDLLDDDKVAFALNHLATLNIGGEVRAINFSLYAPLQIFESSDGRSHLTQFVDWSARRHDVLYVVAWGNADQDEFRKPQDNFNGITVAASEEVDGGSYRKYSSDVNAFDSDTSDALRIDLLAPGHNLIGQVWGSTPALPNLAGTSFAAPHVTGTVALLQQYSENQMDLSPPNPRFGTNSLKHEVMKAVIMNSADKLGGVHGSNREVWDSFDLNWRDSEAYHNPFIPLDDEMGAGHLNARRAVQQLAPGEYDGGMVPNIGWDYGSIGPSETVEYILTGVSGYIAITLAWDRIVNHSGGNTYNLGDQFLPFGDIDDVLNNLDIRLAGPNGNDTVAQSISPDQSLEHIFFEIPNAGDYKIIVEHNGGLGSFQNYALAWWNGSGASPPGDYNVDGNVSSADYDTWKSAYGDTVSPGTGADGNGDGIVDAADYTVWRNNLSAGSGSLTTAPEPSTLYLGIAILSVRMRGRRRRQK